MTHFGSGAIRGVAVVQPRFGLQRFGIADRATESASVSWSQFFRTRFAISGYSIVELVATVFDDLKPRARYVCGHCFMVVHRRHRVLMPTPWKRAYTRSLEIGMRIGAQKHFASLIELATRADAARNVAAP